MQGRARTEGKHVATAEETGQKVQRILIGAFNDVRLTKDGGFAVPLGSSTAFVEPTDWAADAEGNPRSLVRIWAPLGRDVPPTPELFKWAATEGQSKWFGSVTVVEGEDGKNAFVMFDHALLGDFLDPAELVSAVNAIMYTADELDEIVHDRFGGKRYTDPD
jgi:hypothetical protein